MKTFTKFLKILLLVVLIFVLFFGALDAAWILIPEFKASKKLSDIGSFGHEGYQIEIPEGKTIIALGEASHGNAEFQELKLSVLKHLVETTGVRSFALEADYADGILINEYIHGIGDIADAREAVDMLDFQIYQTQQMVDLVQWMHDYNQTTSDADKLSFYGFDMQNPDIDAKVIADYCERNGITPASGSVALLKEYSDKQAKVSDDQKESFYKDIQSIKENLDITSTDALSIAISCDCVLMAKELAALSDNNYIAYNNKRDQFMAEVVSKISSLEKELGHGAIYITGHNGHVGTKAMYYKTMGQSIKEEFGEKYYVIGTDYYKTKCNIASENGRGNHSFCSADPLAYQAKEFGGMYNIRFQDVLDAGAGETYDLLQKPMNTGSLGESYTTLMKFMPMSHRVSMVVTKAYDAMIYVYKTTPIVILDKLQANNDTTLEGENMTEENAAVKSTEETSTDDKDMFASGIATQESSEKTDENTIADSAFVNNGEIEERCPVTFTATRGDVKYGEYNHGTYFSKTCNMERGYSILLPADYSEDKKYPVLYLLHGIFGDEYSFSGDSGNKIKEIVGNMAAEGIIDETIVVCPNMYAATDPDQKPGFDSEACIPYDNFINDLTNDLMPYIESTYSVLTGRDNTYLAGFSMGGRETIYITLQRPELFGYVCAISAAPGVVPTTDKFMTHEGQLQEKDMKFAEDAIIPNVFIICCGTRDSVVGTYPKSYHELLEANGAPHIWYEVTGADHDNNVIKSGLYNLFKQISFDKSEN